MAEPGCGLRLLAPVPHGHWKVTTLVAVCAPLGSPRPASSTAPSMVSASAPYIEQMLAPTLRPKDIVMLDNLTSHKAAGMAEAIAA
jgi:hypothetical protein